MQVHKGRVHHAERVQRSRYGNRDVRIVADDQVRSFFTSASIEPHPHIYLHSDDLEALALQPWDTMFEQCMSQLLGAWSLHYSLSLQQTLYAMATALLQNQPSVAAVRLSLPNKHHFPVDMQPFGLPNDNSTFIAAGVFPNYLAHAQFFINTITLTPFRRSTLRPYRGRRQPPGRDRCAL